MARTFKRDGNYWIDFNDGKGRRIRRKIGPSKRVATEVLDGILGNIARREYLGVIEDSPISFKDFADEWKRRAWHRLAPRTQERWRGILDNHLLAAFPGPLRGITAADLEKYVARRCAEGAQPSTINQEATVMKCMVRKAVDWELRGRNPFLDNQGNCLASLKPLDEPDGRVRFLTDDETDRLLAACDEYPRLRAFVMVSINSGMRRNEVLSLRPSTVDYVNKIATVAHTKNGDTARVPLNRPAIDALRSLPVPLNDGPYFPTGPNQTTMAFGRAVRRAGIKDFRLHDLRHTFCSYQSMNGAQPRALQAMMRHKDPRMTMRYAHLSDKYLRDRVDGLELGVRPDPAKTKAI